MSLSAGRCGSRSSPRSRGGYPPRHYGPWEQFASLLTEGLVARGVDVTLFATADSMTTAAALVGRPPGYSEDPTSTRRSAEALHIAAVFERAGEFD